MGHPFIANRPCCCTLPYGHEDWEMHVCDDRKLSATKVELSKRLCSEFGIHLDWSRYITKDKGQLCWAKSSVGLYGNPYVNVIFHRSLREYTRKKAKLSVENEDAFTITLLINGDL